MEAITDWLTRLFDGTLAAGGIFLIIGIIGCVLLIISLVLDGIFDAFDFGDGPLSLTTIAAFTSIFGFTAFASVGAGTSAGMGAVIGAVAGFVGGAIAWWLTRLIRGAESNSAVSGADLVGRTASVVLAIPETGLGEVATVWHGERVSLAASADTAIARGSAVRITQVITSTSVRVEPLPPADTDVAGTAPDLPAP